MTQMTRRRPHQLAAILFVLLALMVGASRQAGAYKVIDDFETGTGEYTSDTTSEHHTGSTSNIIGGDRIFSLNFTPDDGGTVKVNTSSSSGLFAVNPDSGTSPKKFVDVTSLLYDNNGSGLGGEDITDNGNETHLRMDFEYVDGFLDFSQLDIKITDTSNNSKTVQRATAFNNGKPAFPDAYAFNTSLSLFTGVDLTSVDSIEFIMIQNKSGAGGQDYNLEFIATVPEPGCGILAVIAGMAGMLVRRARRKKDD